MEHFELVLFGVLVAVAALSYLARALDVPYPIFLVVGGVVLGFLPGVPNVELEPDLVLVLFLPPLLYHSAYFASLHELRANTRPIVMGAVGLVLLTMVAVALVVHAVVDGIPWAVAFALGAIVAPTDPIAAVTVARRMGVPRRLVAILEGESLINDATALVAYRAAVAAAIGGSFDAMDATLEFVGSVLGGIAIGVVVGMILIRAFRNVADDPLLTVVTSLVAGYAGYLPAEELHVSGVLAAVTCGLIVGRQSPVLSSAQARLEGYAFWDVLVYVLNAVLFVLIGLQLPSILEDQHRSTAELIGLGALVSAVVIGSRLLFMNTMPYVVRALDRRPQQVARRIGWRLRLVNVWCGTRGSVSLAAALALPLTTDAGAPLPERELVVFLAFSVIFTTLVLQGLTLPLLIRALGIESDRTSEREELIARKRAARAALTRLEELGTEDWTNDDTITRMSGLYDFRYRRLSQRVRGVGEDDEDLEERSQAYQRLVREVIGAQRQAIIDLRNEGEIADEVMHALERELDLEEERLEA